MGMRDPRPSASSFSSSATAPSASSSSSTPALVTNAIVPLLLPHVETLRCPRPPPKSSSERGRLFRARFKQREADTQRRVAVLRREIAALELRRTLRDGAKLQRRDATGGSLCRLVTHYYALFRDGFRDAHGAVVAAQKVAAQREFVMRAYDEAVSLGGGQTGRTALVTQWQLYTAAHRMYRGTIVSMDAQGPWEDPMVVVQSLVETGLTERTLGILFPHVKDDQALRDRLVGRDVVYEATTRFRFTAEDRICSEELEIDLVSGLQRAGVALSDVARLLMTPALSPANTISRETQNERARR